MPEVPVKTPIPNPGFTLGPGGLGFSPLGPFLGPHISLIGPGRPKEAATRQIAGTLLREKSIPLQILGKAAAKLAAANIPISSPNASKIFGPAFNQAAHLEAQALTGNQSKASLKIADTLLSQALTEAGGSHGSDTHVIQALNAPKYVQREIRDIRGPSSPTTTLDALSPTRFAPNVLPSQPNTVPIPTSQPIPAPVANPVAVASPVSARFQPPAPLLPQSVGQIAGEAGAVIGRNVGAERFGFVGGVVGGEIGRQLGEFTLQNLPNPLSIFRQPGGAPTGPPPSYLRYLAQRQPVQTTPPGSPPSNFQPSFQPSQGPVQPLQGQPVEQPPVFGGGRYCPECDPTGRGLKLMRQQQQLEKEIQTEQGQQQDKTVGQQQQQIDQFQQLEQQPSQQRDINQELQQKQQLLDKISQELQQLAQEQQGGQQVVHHAPVDKSTQPMTPETSSTGQEPVFSSAPLDSHGNPELLYQKEPPSELPNPQNAVVFCVGCATNNDAFQFLNGEPSNCSVMPNKV